MGKVGFNQEKETFAHVKEHLRILSERHLTNFCFVFPFGCPEGALKSTISLLERVSSIHFMGKVGFNQEKESLAHVKERLRILLECHLTNFRFVFPFGCPEGALKSTISLLERVSGINSMRGFRLGFVLIRK